MLKKIYTDSTQVLTKQAKGVWGIKNHAYCMAYPVYWFCSAGLEK